MENGKLTALSPLDGRYSDKTSELSSYMSEYGLIRYRLVVEVEWLKLLSNEDSFTLLTNFTAETSAKLDAILENFDVDEAQKIKDIEAVTNHDVKAVEYYLNEKFSTDSKLKAVIPFIHFACTSEDINNLAYSLMLNEARSKVMVPKLREVIGIIREQSHQLSAQPMLSRTHGQTASPTTMGKELSNFVARLENQLSRWLHIELKGKINGAVGNYNAHTVAAPEVNWPEVAEQLVAKIGLGFNPYTTQIEPHDCIAEYCYALCQINTILLDLSRDVWSYVSIGYFNQKKIDNEVGSSTMPHKINPIDFENAEGNLGVSCALLQHFAQKLPVSRLQRDLTDSTVLRNMGSGLGYCLIALKSLIKGLNKLEINAFNLNQDLENAWEVLAEPIQTSMRGFGIEDAYEHLKKFSRGRKINKQMLHEFIDTLPIPLEKKEGLKRLKPSTYIGLAEILAKKV
jgi:adenylosuccinate lyase